MRLTSSSPSVNQAVQLWHPFSYTNWDVIAPDIRSSVTPFQLCLPRIRWRHAQLSWISTTYDVHHMDVPCVCTLSAILRISLPFSRKNTHLEDLEDKVLIMYQKNLGEDKHPRRARLDTSNSLCFRSISVFFTKPTNTLGIFFFEVFLGVFILQYCRTFERLVFVYCKERSSSGPVTSGGYFRDRGRRNNPF